MSIDAFEKQISDCLTQLGLTRQGGKVLCAVSGGADSMCLLSALLRLSLDLSCAHFNHRLRGDESERDARFVEEFCLRNGIEFHLGYGDVAEYAAENGLGTEDAARRLRYAFLEETAIKSEASYIATAHTADDNLETMLMNLVRGAGSRGMSGIPPRRGRIIRPLLFATRGQVEEYLTQRGVSWVEDSSNATDNYTRNRVRHHIIPALHEINSSAAKHALETARLIREDDEYISSLAAAFLAEHEGVSVIALLNLPDAVSSRVLRIASGVKLSAVHVRALMKLCESGSPSGELDIPGIRARREYDRLIFDGESPCCIEPFELTIGETAGITGTELKISSKEVEVCPEIYNSLTTFYFHIDSICGNITVRQRAVGDKIKLVGKNGSTSLKKLFIDKRIPRSQRESIPVLADDNGPIAVFGFGASVPHTAKQGEKALFVKIKKCEDQTGATPAALPKLEG